MTAGCPAPPAPHYGWLRRRSRSGPTVFTTPHPGPAAAPILIIQDESDFVRCGYGGCGGLRPLTGPAAMPACPACGRL